jgi:hypothetical protein
MPQNLDCTCKIVVAVEAINNLRRYIDDFVQEPPEKPYEVDEQIVQDRTNWAVKTLNDAAQVCGLNLEDVKAKVNLTNLSFQNRKYYVALDHVIDAKQRLESKVCVTGV